jgi:hypothetical protein
MNRMYSGSGKGGIASKGDLAAKWIRLQGSGIGGEYL